MRDPRPDQPKVQRRNGATLTEPYEDAMGAQSGGGFLPRLWPDALYTNTRATGCAVVSGAVSSSARRVRVSFASSCVCVDGVCATLTACTYTTSQCALGCSLRNTCVRVFVSACKPVESYS